MLTIPTLGWVAKLGPNRAKLPSFSVTKYGAQKSTDPYLPDAGNGVLAGGANVTGNDPNDADVPADANFQAGWINHIVSQWGAASSGGLQYYIMDNEPSLWYSTHRDVHPVGPTMDEVTNDILAYGAKVKATDPTASVVAPEEWGWSGYFSSGYDQQYGAAHNYQGHPDRDAHGGMDYLPWLLSQVHKSDLATGKRSLDVFSVHFYPQGGEFSDAVDTRTVLLRNRSTRQLWDPNYVAESWIGDTVMLIPRIKGWVNSYYPGTKTAITEYNWGADGNISGATAQADIFGIFGREGLDLATRWTMPAANTPTYQAMKLYRNYDGKKSAFGDTSVSDVAPDPGHGLVLRRRALVRRCPDRDRHQQESVGVSPGHGLAGEFYARRDRPGVAAHGRRCHHPPGRRGRQGRRDDGQPARPERHALRYSQHRHPDLGHPEARPASRPEAYSEADPEAQA